MVDDELLELRVHGVNNTPPVSLLYAIQEEYGDSLVGVYRLRSNTGLVKAFSWGGLARMSPIPRIPFANWVRSVGSAAWIFVLPFGLANVAYWSRELALPRQNLNTVRATAALARVFSLGLTLLLASSVCSVSLDMAEGRVLKDPLPGWLSWLRNHLDAGDRMAIFSLAPLLAVLFLWGLATWTRVRYDWGSKVPETGSREEITPGAAQHDVWKFGSQHFWDNADLSAHNAAVHTAAGVALSLIWTGQFWFIEHHCIAYAVITVAVAIILVCVVLIWIMPLVTEANEIKKSRNVLAQLMLWTSLGMFAAQSLALIFWHSPKIQPRPLAALSFVPGALVFILLVFAVSALGWRWWRPLSYFVAAVPILLGAAALLAHHCRLVAKDDLKVVDGLLIVILVVLAVAWLSLLYRRANRHTDEAWGGTAPGVLMILSLFAAALLSTVFVIAAAALLGDGNPKINQGELVTVPPIYLSFASMLTPLLVALLLAGIIIVWRVVLRSCNPVEPELDAATQPDIEEIAHMAKAFDAAHPVARDTARRAVNRLCDSISRRRLIRSLAAVAHRAEPIVAQLAVVAAAALCGGLVLALILHSGAVANDVPLLRDIRGLGVGLAAVIGVAIVGAGASSGRPLGIVWDLICFLPRAAHPFGPPCYAQRAVPELLNYCRAWLDTPTNGENPTPRRLILSAHSLGGVLAVAIVLLLADHYKTRIALVTYGCQLRAYFGRIFPELLGPRILGVTKSHSARLLGCPTFGPGQEDSGRLPEPSPTPDGKDPASVRDTLTETNVIRWINLWRPTDYLGFPVYSRKPGNGVDRPADEVTAEVSDDGRIVVAKSAIDLQSLDSSVPLTTLVRFEPTITFRVDTHGDYFRAPQYPVAISDLTTRLAPASTT